MLATAEKSKAEVQAEIKEIGSASPAWLTGNPPTSGFSEFSLGVSYGLAIGGNSPPVVPRTVSLSALANRETIIHLLATDPNNDPLRFRINYVAPPYGELYQYSNGARGEQIVALETVVTDPQGR